MITIPGKYTTAKVMIDNIEEGCISQITTFINHPAFTNPVAIMPDCHQGKGSVIGFTMKLTNKIIPNIVGVDIGCGILSFNVGSSLPISLKELDDQIRLSIPFGMAVHSNAITNMERAFPWTEATDLAHRFLIAYQNKFQSYHHYPIYNNEWFLKKCEQVGGGTGRIINSLGTLGGGNHFIETGISTKGEYWITIHSGSRNFGKRICDYWQGKASSILRREKTAKLKEMVDDIKSKYSGVDVARQIESAKESLGLNNKITTGLEYLEGDDAVNYLFDMVFAQVYAKVNREYMKNIICRILKMDSIDEIETTHNFIDFKDFIIRKGAIRSYVGERMVIPFNMRDGILICEGKSNPEWNYSAPHGAGRVMSRSVAKRSIDLDTFKQQMNNIYSTSVGTSTLDEAPEAYKDPEIIRQAIEPTAVILDSIKPIHNMKATN